MLLQPIMRAAALAGLEELTLSSASPRPKALDIAAMPPSLQRLAYRSPASFIHLVRRSSDLRSCLVDGIRCLSRKQPSLRFVAEVSFMSTWLSVAIESSR